MPPYARRRHREPDPVVAARLRAISYADPYVFVHASDVLEPEPPADEGVSPSYGGWVPEPPPPVPPEPVRPLRPPWVDLVRQRLEPARTGVAALIVIGLVAAAVAGVVFIRAQPSGTASPLPVHSSSTLAPATTSSTAVAPMPATTLLVDVTGKVRHPGVVKVRNGARVIDALRAAGGVLPGTSLDSLNLASKLTDGQQVAVGPAAAAAAPAAVVGGGGAVASAGPVDLNSATVAQLLTLPGIGPVLAQRIIDYRTAHGPFASVDGLQQVGGIGPSKFQALKPHVTP